MALRHSCHHRPKGVRPASFAGPGRRPRRRRRACGSCDQPCSSRSRGRDNRLLRRPGNLTRRQRLPVRPIPRHAGRLLESSRPAGTCRAAWTGWPSGASRRSRAPGTCRGPGRHRAVRLAPPDAERQSHEATHGGSAPAGVARSQARCVYSRPEETARRAGEPATRDLAGSDAPDVGSRSAPRVDLRTVTCDVEEGDCEPSRLIRTLTGAPTPPHRGRVTSGGRRPP